MTTTGYIRHQTLSLARQGVYATEQEARRYGERGSYESTDLNRQTDYIAARRSISDSLEQSALTDA